MITRNPYFDFLRGFAIIMVVGIHTVTSMSPDFNTVEGIVIIILRSLLNCAVPLFLAISGYFIASKKISFGKEHISFLKKQIPKIYIPCLIFSIPYLTMSLISGSNGILKPLAIFFACGFSVYYFVALIIQYYLLLPIFIKFNGFVGLVLTVLISALSIIGVTYVIKYEGIELPLLIYAGLFPLWILFFFMGVFFSNHNRNYKITYPLILTITGLILQILEYQFWMQRDVTALGIKMSSFIFSAGMIWLLFSKKMESTYSEKILMKTVNWIGGISFGIYLLHCYVIIAVSKIVPEIGWIEKWTLVLCITVLLIWIAKSIFPKFSVKYLGFR